MTEAHMSSDPPALFERHGHVGLITLNRPHAMNAVSAAMSVAVEEAVRELEADPDLRVGVLTGAGKAFCAGADLKELAAGRRLVGPHQRETGFGGFTRRPVTKPLVAAVNGYALGGGTEIMLACDLAVMSEDAVLGLPEVRHGVIAAEGGLLRLPQRMPPALAMEAILTGSPISAESAVLWGLVNQVVAAGEVLDAALALAAKVARNAPLAVQASKRLVQARGSLGSDWEAAAWQASDTAIKTLLTSEDFKEGPRAFAEKRRPVWTGR